MKCQILFSGKNSQKFCLQNFLPRMPSVQDIVIILLMTKMLCQIHRLLQFHFMYVLKQYTQLTVFSAMIARNTCTKDLSYLPI